VNYFIFQGPIENTQLKGLQKILRINESDPSTYETVHQEEPEKVQRVIRNSLKQTGKEEKEKVQNLKDQYPLDEFETKEGEFVVDCW